MSSISTEALCVVLDGRPGHGNARTEFFRLWVGAMQEMIVLCPEALPALSIITLHDGFYESCLPLAKHSVSVLSEALCELEQNWVFSPLGIGSTPWTDDRAGNGGLVPEHAAQAWQGLPVNGRQASVPPAKRGRKAAAGRSGSPKRRLFAVGEDCALAALRSALAQLAAQHVSGGARLEYWTLDAEKLWPMAAEIVKCVPRSVDMSILSVVGTGGKSLQLIAKAKVLDKEFQSFAMRSNVAMRVHTVCSRAGAFAQQVRRPLQIFVPLFLDMSVHGAAEEVCSRVPLVATPVTLLTSKQRIGVASLSRTTCALSVICRVRAGNVSGELLYGVPFFLQCAAGLSAPGVEQFQMLTRELRERQESLVMSLPVCPISLAPSRSPYVFLAMAGPIGPVPSSNGPVMMLRGLAFSANWQPAATLAAPVDTNREAAGHSVTTHGASLSSGRLILEDIPELDPSELRRTQESCTRAAGA